MNYQDALREWGARRLEADDAARRAWDRANGLEPCPLEPCPVDRSTVGVHMEFVPEDIIGSSMGTVQDIHHRHVRLLARADGWSYTYEKEEERI